MLKKEINHLRQDSKKDLEIFKQEILSAIQEKYKIQDEKINQLSNTINSFQAELLISNKRYSDLDESHKFLSCQHDTLLEKNNKLEVELNFIHKEIEKRSNSELVLEELKYKINEQEQQSRSNNMEVYGIPENASENISKIVMDITKFIGVELVSKDIIYASRIKHKKTISGLPKPIIV